MIIQQLVNGVTLGSIYALTALGYTLIFGSAHLINFAQGEITMVGAFAALGTLALIGYSSFLQAHPILQFFLMFFVALTACSIVGIIVDWIAFRPLRPLRTVLDIDPLITSLGVSIFLQNAVLIFIGSQNFVFPNVFVFSSFTVGSAVITYLQILIVVLAVVLMLALYTFVQLTKWGKAIRAIAINPRLARLMGINLNHTITLTFVIASQLAAAAGIMFGLYYSVCKYDMGFVLGIKAMTAAILGGMGNIPGAVVGGLILGLVEALGAGYISSDYKDVFTFIVLMVVLVFCPSGLFGEKSLQTE